MKDDIRRMKFELQPTTRARVELGWCFLLIIEL